MKNILIISALAGVLALSSCWRDDLYYATVDRATVRIEADWTPARLTPNGVSAFVFDRNGAAFDVVRSNDSRKADLSLPEGFYSVVVLNNTLDEYRNIESAGTDRLETFALMGRAVSPNFTSLGGGTRAESFIGEPDTVAGSVVRNIEVTRKMIEYFRTKPHGMEPAPAAVYQTALSLAELEGRYGSLGLFRAGKSSIVNLHRVRALKSQPGGRIEVTLETEERLVVSRHYAPLLRERLGL